MAQQHTLHQMEAMGKFAYNLLYSGPNGLRSERVTSVAELKNKLEPNIGVEELRFDENCVMSRELLEALKGMTVQELCVMPASFESDEVYKAFLNVIAKTEVIMLTATLPGFEDVRQVQPFIACRCLNLGEDIHACDRMGWTKENIVKWLHLKHQWDHGVRVMTIHVEPKQAAEIAQHILQEFDGDKVPHAFETFIHANSGAFNGLHHCAFNAIAGDYIFVSYVEGVLHIKRDVRTNQGDLKGMLGAVQVGPVKMICELLAKASE